jgi:hypothetical protein
MAMQPKRRFVILHHTGFGREHWDLMLEHEGVLLTWQLFAEPGPGLPIPIEASRIGDHRRAYLDYEGPVSGGRGFVKQVDSGSVYIEQLTADRCRFRAGGSRLSGAYELLLDPRGWTLRPAGLGAALGCQK